MEFYHFIGIGGIGMSSLALILLERGIQVSGSDLFANERTHRLQNRGATVYIGHKPEQVPIGATLVYHCRIPQDHPELLPGQPKIHRLDLLKQVIGELPIYAVVGAHGKTSTSALLAHVLHRFDSSFGYSVGGVLSNTQENGRDGSIGFAIEGDESDASFLRIHPSGAIITNIEPDHLDFWGDFAALQKGYQQFVDQIQNPDSCFFAADEDGGIEIPGVSYGIEKGVIQAWNIEVFDRGSRFTILDTRTQDQNTFFLPSFGTHQIKNALGVYGMCRFLGLPIEAIQEGFESYKGVRRRCETKGDYKGIRVYSDYGHHPTELAATFRALKSHHKTPLTVVFEPHKFTRTKQFFEEFVEALGLAEQVFLWDTYPAGETLDPLGSSERLAERLNVPILSMETLKSALDIACGVILFIGAGNIDQVCTECLSSVAYSRL